MPGTQIFVPPLLKLDQLEAGCPEDCCGNADLPAHCAGRAPRLEIDGMDIMQARKVQYLLGSPDEIVGQVGPGFCKHPGFSSQDIGTVPAGDVGGLPGGWQAAQLLRTNWDPNGLLKFADTVRIIKGFAVISGAKADKAGADKID